MYRWGIFCALCIYLLLSSRPVVAAFSPSLLTRELPATTSHTAFPATTDDNLRGLAAGADLIVQGRVLALRSFWNHDHTLIESEATVAVSRSWLGQVGRAIQIRTTGGYLAADQVGLASMHEATFAVGEEVLLFAQQTADSWRVVAGAQGKFQLQHELLFNQDLPLPQARADFFARLGAVLTTNQLPTQVSLEHRVAQLKPVPAVNAALRPALTGQTRVQRWATPHATANFLVNLNSTQLDTAAGDRAAFRAAIISAAQSWSAVESADFALTYGGETGATQTGYNGINEVLFMAKGATERAAAAQVWYRADGTIIEADIWINDDYRWNATGQPAVDEVDLQSALLHEFGHWLILGHTDYTDSVMFPRLTTGTIKRNLQAQDMAGISTIYPR